MGRNRQASFAKRKREQARQQRAAEKRARRKARSANRNQSGGEGDDMLAAPLNTKPTDDEVMRAVERAMHPGRARSSAGAGDADSAKLFVGNVDYSTGEEDLSKLFSEAGFDVVNVSIGRDRATGESRGFAFVELATPMQAGQALERLDGVSIAGRELRLSEARESHRR